MIPFTGLISPLRASSPINALLSRFDCKSWFDEERIEMAIGRSSCVPVLWSSAGAKLTVILWGGKVNREFVMADLMR